MNRLPEEDRLTAYALGELSPAEAAEVEALLATSPEARQELEEIRACAGVLTEAFRQETESISVQADEPAATPEVIPIHVVETKPSPADPTVVPMPETGRRWSPWLGIGLAAGLTVAVGIGLWRERTPLTLARQDASSPTLDAFQRASADANAKPGNAEAVSALSAATAPRPEPPPVASGVQPLDSLSAQVPAQPPTMEPQLMRRYGLAPGAGSGSALPTLEAKDKSESVRTLAQSIQPLGEVRLAEQLADASSVPRIGDRPTVGQQFDRGESVAQRGRTTLALSRAATPSDDAKLAKRPGETWEFREQLAFEARDGEMLQRSLRDEANPGYVDAGENPFVSPLTQPLSTFGLDVDTGSYANVRRFLKAGSLPPRAAVRVEEMLNYFDYAYPAAAGDEVFRLVADVGPCPWQPEHRVVRLALKTRDVVGEPPVANLVFLVDVSGSMQPAERLPLLKNALRSLAKRLAPTDRVAIVTYASGSQLRLPSTTGEERDRILEVIDALEAGGSTNGEGGIRQAYAVARQHFINGGVNRVILCTDGDFNVGISDQNALVDLIRQEAKSGVFLTTLGVGTDNFKDALMRRLADSGNGSYHYLDSFEEAHRVLLEQQRSRFVVVARDAKAQVEFNPATVAAWRQIGYEKRALPAEAFNDDTKDGGEVGAGQTVTVLYEVVPAGVRVPGAVDPLKYQPAAREEPLRPAAAASSDLLTFKVRYQRPEGSASVLRELAVRDAGKEPSRAAYPGAERDRQFALALVAFAQALRDPSWHGGRGFDLALEMAREGQGADPGGVRAEFIALVRMAKSLSGR